MVQARPRVSSALGLIVVHNPEEDAALTARWCGVLLMRPYSTDYCRLRFVVLVALVCGFGFPWLAPSVLGQDANAGTPAAGVQSSTTSSGQPGTASAPEISSQDNSVTYKLNVDMVLVRVVVRDAQGKPVANLKKEDFLLFDKGKPQVISSFAVETPASHAAAVKNVEISSTAATAANTGGAAISPSALPQRFVALYFDDLHLEDSHAIDTKQAALKFLNSMVPTDRVAIFTSSAHLEEPFTNNREKLAAAIQQISPHPLSSGNSSADCPPLTYYQAYQITQGGDPMAMQVAIADLPNCSARLQTNINVEKSFVYELAVPVQAEGEQEQRAALRNLDAVIRRMGILPGQRVIVVVSPGFYVDPTTRDQNDLIDRATKVGVVVNTLDARGLYTSSLYDAANREHVDQFTAQFRETERSIMQDVLASIAYGTGGEFFHNRNDLDQGLVQLAAQPEVSYVLGFSPHELKLDGKYHALKVSLASKSNWRLEARRGYFAPLGSDNPENAAYEEIDQALGSQEELRGLSLQCETQMFKMGSQTRLSVVARIDTKGLKFRRMENRNEDNLKVVMALFDNNGTFLSALERGIKLQLKDTTLSALNKTGIRVKMNFDMQPGTYVVRVVVHDSEGAQLGATSQGVVIPE